MDTNTKQSSGHGRGRLPSLSLWQLPPPVTRSIMRLDSVMTGDGALNRIDMAGRGAG